MIFISSLCTFSGHIFNNFPLISGVGVVVDTNAIRKQEGGRISETQLVSSCTQVSRLSEYQPQKKIAVFVWSYYKNHSLLRWDWRAIIAFQLGLTPNKAHLNCPESNQGSLFSEEFGNFSCVQFGTGYCSDALFRRGKKGGW